MASVECSAQGILVVSIDLEPPAIRRSVRPANGLDATTRRLIELFRCYELPATWAVADPVHSAATERLVTLGVRHEIAVMGDSTWVGRQAGRGRFAQELARRVLKARAAGLAISTLVPSGVLLDDHLDLLVKHEISAVRGLVDQAGRSSAAAQPSLLHYGLWELPGSLLLPGESRWWPGKGRGLRARRGIDRAASQAKVFHLVVSVPGLEESGRTALSTLERVIRHAARRRDADQLQNLTLAELAGQLCQTTKSEPSRSVLRAAG